MIAPARIWIAPTHRSNGVDDFYLLDPEFRGNRGTEYVRADLVDELVRALELARDNHGKMLLSDPPQEAWKAKGVDEAIRSALAQKGGEA